MTQITIGELIKFLHVEKNTDYLGIDYILALIEDQGVPTAFKTAMIVQCIQDASDVFDGNYVPRELGDIQEIGDVEEGQIIPMENFVFEFMGVKYEFRVVLN